MSFFEESVCNKLAVGKNSSAKGVGALLCGIC